MGFLLNPMNTRNAGNEKMDAHLSLAGSNRKEAFQLG
jgi:hypothetical protein